MKFLDNRKLDKGVSTVHVQRFFFSFSVLTFLFLGGVLMFETQLINQTSWLINTPYQW